MRKTSERNPIGDDAALKDGDKGRSNPGKNTPASVIDEILPFSQYVFCPRDKALVMQGIEPRGCYYVQRGCVDVSFTAGETKIVVAIIGEGCFFGEIGYFDGVSRVRDIRAVEDSEIRVFKKKALEMLQRERPDLYGKFMAFLAKSICRKFRRVLEEREPLESYATALSAGRRSFPQPEPVAGNVFETPEWKFVNCVVEDFKAKMFDISLRLQEDPGPDIAGDLWRQGFEIIDGFNEQFVGIESRLRGKNSEKYVWGHLFKEVYPYFMRSRFAERAFFKPNGYAGDYLMVEMIYRNRPDGDGKLGKLVDGWLLSAAPARAVRGRLEVLPGQLARIARNLLDQDRIDIMTLACGPNRELFQFLARCPYSEKIRATCVDIDLNALQYIDEKIDVFPHKASIRLMNENLLKWIQGCVRHNFGKQDIVYASGLANYLDRGLLLAMLNRCHSTLKPGGHLIVGNIADNPCRSFVERILRWDLIYRSPEHLRDIFGQTPFGDSMEVITESEGIHLFAVARKTT